jgi:hypothetical protein
MDGRAFLNSAFIGYPAYLVRKKTRRGTGGKEQEAALKSTVTLNLFQGPSPSTLKTKTLKQVQGDGTWSDGQRQNALFFFLHSLRLCVRYPSPRGRGGYVYNLDI